MPRRARNERLETRTARLKLPVRREPHWFTFQEGRALGYRRLPSGRGGTWIARRYDSVNGRGFQALGDADDYAEADGVDVLTFAQAQEKASSWFAQVSRAGGKMVRPITVGEALDGYLLDYGARGGKALAQTRQAIDAHIRPALGNKLVGDLTPTALRTWHHALAAAPARLRGAKVPKDGVPAPKRKVRAAIDPDAKRARRATANRLLTILRATLNYAYREGTAPSDHAWRKVKPFAKADAPRIRYLTDDESRRLLNACAPEARILVKAALLTGCRYGELAALTAADLDLGARMLTIRQSKSGRPRSVVLTDEAAEFFGQQATGKAGRAPLLTRVDGGTWGKSHQFRPLREACAGAKIAPAVSFHILRHTYASRLVQRGVPMAVIAAQLGNEENICARHYAHLSPGYVAETVRQAFGRLEASVEMNVTSIRQTGG